MSATTTLTPDTISFVCSTVRDRSAIELDVSKAYLIEARLTPVARECGFNSIGALVEGVRTKRKPEWEARLVEAMTTNETSFFRDIHPFNSLRTTILPELIRVRAAQQSLNIWSAACSTGQELYSTALLLREHFPHLHSWKLDLVGTDLSDEVLKRAQQARFSQIEVNRGMPAQMLVKYFQRDGINWQLQPEVRKGTRFLKLNLIERWPQLPSMDIVFLRNVLIYFSPETKKLILEKVRKVMLPHAVLFLGAAETTLGLDDAFLRVQSDNSVYYRLK